MLIFSAVDSLLGSFQGSREKKDKKILKNLLVQLHSKDRRFFISHSL
jgi:hypothetical protein